MIKRLLLAVLTIVVLASNSFGEGVNEQTPTPDSEAQSDIIWIDSKLPDKAVTEGRWAWDENLKQEDTVPHTNGGDKGLSSHSFTTDTAIEMNKDSKIIQYVYLDPKDAPRGIMMKFMTQDPKALTLYWEGEEETFADYEDYLTAWYMGLLPKNGEWAKLEIGLKEMDITEVRIKGISFISSGGKIWWGKTIIKGGRYVEEKTQGQA